MPTQVIATLLHPGDFSLGEWAGAGMMVTRPTSACSGPESVCLSSTTCALSSYLPAAEAQRWALVLWEHLELM